MNTIAISEARSNLPDLVDKAADLLHRFVITVSGKPKAVLMSIEEIQSLEETAEIMTTKGAWQAIMAGKKETSAIKKGRKKFYSLKETEEKLLK